MKTAPNESLLRPLRDLRGIGSERAAQLERLGLRTVGNLLQHAPRRYQDRTHLRPIRELTLNETATIQGKVVTLGINRFRKGTKTAFVMILDDGTARLHCRWWNMPFMENQFAQGEHLIVWGKLRHDRPRTMDHPETEKVEAEEEMIHLNRIVPVYPLTEGMSQRWLRGLIWRVVADVAPGLAEPRLGVTMANHPSYARAIQDLHFPATWKDSERARARLALEEFLDLHLSMQRRRRNLEQNAKAPNCTGDNRLIKPFLKQLGFDLTPAQASVLRELRHDMSGTVPMRRLLQGDVGSGKTVVAACCALMALEARWNVALMAPTEVLAEQHFATFQKWFSPLGLRTGLMTGSRKTEGTPDPANQVRLPLSAETEHGDGPSLVIGTHALIEESYSPGNLGLVIIDEQHKFGVAQREQLLRKGKYPHLLVMTATPIPRTLGLTLYADLDISVIDQMPAGRKPIKTVVRPAERLDKVLEFVREKLREGRQAYVVYPRVEETAPGLKAVKAEFENLQRRLAPFQAAVLHGRIKPAEKVQIMESFRKNTIQVLLATSLIEVGLDVPNATIMLVENAEQFGLAQLHQLRGRVGRGAEKSYCILLSDNRTEEARLRLKTMEEIADGFGIAEADLQQRGAGDLLGREQSGLPPLQFGDLQRDRTLIEEAREIARYILAKED